MTTPRVVDALREAVAGAPVALAGWVRTARHAKARSFIELGDGSSLAGVQAVCDPAMEEYETVVKTLATGCAVRIEGVWAESPGAGQRFEIHARRVILVGGVGDDYPLQKKKHSLEFLRGIQHLRLRTNTLGAVARVRNTAAMAIHQFFQQRGFVWLHTPIITASDAEGAGALFRVTTLDPADPPRDDTGAVDYARDFFGRPAFLTVSGQLEGEIGALALRDVYTFGPTFRAENSNTPRHLAEFWMVEPEMAFCDLDGDAALAEAFLKEVVAAVLERSGDDIAFFNDRVEAGLRARLEGVAMAPFERMTYTEAVKRLEASGEAFEYPVAWGLDLQTCHERWLTETHVGRPVIVTDYPKAIKAFYMYANDDGRTARGMDVLAPGAGEIIGGAQREDRIDVLRARMEEMALPVEGYAWYLDLRRHGGAPHSGFGLGFERLMLMLTGLANIRDVIPFPRVPGHASL